MLRSHPVKAGHSKQEVQVGNGRKMKHQTCVRGYHVCQNTLLGEVLQFSSEVSNAHDPFVKSPRMEIS